MSEAQCAELLNDIVTQNDVPSVLDLDVDDLGRSPFPGDKLCSTSWIWPKIVIVGVELGP